MIHLDANYLMLATVAGSPEDRRVRAWLTEGEMLATSAIAWMEFVTGPVSTEAVFAMALVVQGRIQAIQQAEAELAADLFNRSGRKRALRYDCLIAASAILDQALLATRNRTDFAVFAAHGLRVVP